MITTVSDICLLALAVSMAMCLWRLVRGPSTADRALALDTMYTNLMAAIVVLCIRYNTAEYFDAALVIAVLGFLSTTAIAKYLIKGDIIE
jgi:multicomponent K+:H+ antiporter subunit F